MLAEGGQDALGEFITRDEGAAERWVLGYSRAEYRYQQTAAFSGKRRSCARIGAEIESCCNTGNAGEMQWLVMLSAGQC